MNTRDFLFRAQEKPVQKNRRYRNSTIFMVVCEYYNGGDFRENLLIFLLQANDKRNDVDQDTWG